MNRFVLIVPLIFSALFLKSQPSGRLIEGQVSFVSSINVYINFPSTENMNPGDTLYVKNDQSFSPALKVIQKSSISCICKPLMDLRFVAGQKVFSFIKEKKVSLNQKPDQSEPTKQDKISKVPPQPVSSESGPLVRGRLSLSSYTMLVSASEKNNTRFRYNLNLDIGNSQHNGFSAESYLMYTHKINNSMVPEGLRVYNLALHYKLNDHFNAWFGRKINERIANVGAIDGLQIEAKSHDLYLGATGGFRPGYLNYEFDKNLFQYGAWLGHYHNFSSGQSIGSTLALFQQNNGGKTDRRFAYFQHDNNLIKNFNLFVSSEIDLYKLVNNSPVSTFSITSIFLSVRYRVNRQFSLFGSFDQRKNVIYYETFRSFGDSLYEAVKRQGLQFRINWRPNGKLMLSVNSGHQFPYATNFGASDHVGGYLILNKVPGLNGSLTVSSNLIRTQYLNGKSGGVKLEKEFLEGKVTTGAGYRLEYYQFLATREKISNSIAELNLSWLIYKKLILSCNVEKAFTGGPSDYLNIYTSLIKRF